MSPFPAATADAAPAPRNWLLLLAAGLALAQLPVGFLAPPGRPGPRAYPLLVARGGLESYPEHAGFAANAVYPVTPAAVDFPGVECFGSWLDGNESTGKFVTPWFRPGAAGFDLLVAGYPSTHGNSVTLELRRVGEADDAPPVRRPLVFEDAHEGWTHQRVRLAGADAVPFPAGAAWEARVVATDGGTGPAGWLGVSAPFREGRHTLLWSLGVLGRLALALGAAVTGVVGVGLALRWKLLGARAVSGTPWWAHLALTPLPGAAALVATALLCWRLAPAVDPRGLAAAGLAGLFGFAAVVFARAPAAEVASAAERRVLVIAGLVLLLALGKAQFSAGPAGELYGETVSRTLEVGGRSDSRIAFHTVQLVAHGTSPFSREGSGFYAPWGFTSRGPLLALASAPLVLASGARVPMTMPDQGWLPWDPEGFAVYRLAMMALGAAALLPLFGAAGALLGGGKRAEEDRAGLLAVALAALTPFVVHEVYFTWGKLSTAGCLAASAYALGRRRFLAAGALAGVGYLCHPLTLLYVPFLGLGALWLAVRDGGVGRALAAGVRFGVPLLAALAFWHRVGRGDRELNFGQGFFLNYLFGPSQWEAFDPGVWARHRLESTLNTLVPGWLFFVNSGHPEMNALYARSAWVVHWFFQYWNTLPFGLGVLGLPVLLRRWWAAARARPGVFALTAAGPFALFAVYWGAAPTGMMREGLHPWVFALLVLAASAPPRAMGRAEAALLSARGLEVLAMCLLPTLLTSPALPRPAYAWVDAAMLGLQCAALAALSVLCFRTYRDSPRHARTDAITNPSPDAPASAAASPSTGPRNAAGSTG